MNMPLRFRISRSVTLWGLLLALASCGGILIYGTSQFNRFTDWLVYGTMLHSPRTQYAIYQDKVFECHNLSSDTISSFWTGTIDNFKIDGIDLNPTSNEIVDYYLRWPDGTVDRLRTLSEAKVIQYYETHPCPLRNTYHVGAPHNLIQLGFGYAEFRKGTLVFFSINQGSNFAFSPRLMGPFHTMPMTKTQMRQEFGEPLRWITVQSTGIY